MSNTVALTSTKTRPPELKNRKLIIVSNREPVQIHWDKKSVQFTKPTGGLVSALDPVLESCNGLWICWDGDKLEAKTGFQDEATMSPPPHLQKSYQIHRVRLSKAEVDYYYYRFSNQLIWPLFHYFQSRPAFHEEDWRAYNQVNQKFARAILEHASPRDLIWIQDYHLMRTPHFVREVWPEANLGFFCHIPFPHFEVFRTIPTARELLKGMLGSDIIGFHTESYAQYFMECCLKLLQDDVEALDDSHLVYEGRKIQVKAAPISIDYQTIHRLAESSESIQAVRDLRQSLFPARWMGIGVDRLDYTKGILERLECIELLLKTYPQYQKQLVFVQIAVPSRTRIPEYQRLRHEIDRAVGRINGELSQEGWSPIHYLYRSFPLEELVNYYKAADFALVNPLRDGMNLVAKEYCAAQTDEEGCLILSEITGAADELKDSFLINPYDYPAVVETLHTAIQAPYSERIRRMGALRKVIQRDNINAWLNDFLWSFSAAIHQRTRYQQNINSVDAGL